MTLILRTATDYDILGYNSVCNYDNQAGNSDISDRNNSDGLLRLSLALLCNALLKELEFGFHLIISVNSTCLADNYN